jgi:hypothetical protein
LTIKSVISTIKWPKPASSDWPDSSEHHVIFQGNQTVEPEESRTFENVITSGFWGSFSTETSIVALGMADVLVSE